MLRLSLTLYAVFLITTLSSGGPNSNSVLYINFSTDTSKIDSVKLCQLSDTIVAGIQVQNAVNLYDYEIYIGFDTSRLQFLSGKKEYSSQKNVLETKSGSAFFSCSYSKKDSTKIIIGGSILGDDETQCPDGSGFLGFLTFIKKTADTTAINITSSLLETYNTSVDTMIKAVNGIIYPGSSAIIKHKTVQPHFTVQKAGGVITIFSPDITPQSIQLFTIDGRCLTRISAVTQKTSIPLSSITGNGPCVIRVQCRDNRYSTLMINN